MISAPAVIFIPDARVDGNIPQIDISARIASKTAGSGSQLTAVKPVLYTSERLISQPVMRFLHRKWIDVSSFDIMRFISEMMQHPLCSRLYHTAVFCEQGEMLLVNRIQNTLLHNAIYSFIQVFRLSLSLE